MNPLLLTDAYKVGHHLQYPKGTSLVYSNFTPRSNKYAPKGCDEVVSFGQQMILKQIHEAFQNEFFSKPKEEVCGEMKRELSLYLSTDYDVSHFEALHDLGYLPIHVKGIKEGTLVPIKVPVLIIYNTKPEFYWVTNYLETIISNLLWKPMTSATIAHTYRKVLSKWQEKTDKERAWFIDWQGHDFSMRGMDSIDATISSGLGHATSFLGSDSLPVIHGARKYYNETSFVAGSVNATEHSVACAHMNIFDGKIDETSYITHLLETYPTGILSMVSDTFNLWDILTVYLPRFKEQIMARDGKLVVRPDSGDPVDIVCGIDDYIQYEDGTIYTAHYTNGIFRDRGRKILLPEQKGVIELLWDVFGGTVNDQGYKVLDPHIGAIYGDSISIDRAEQICKRLEAKGFASTNIVLGVGSFTYQFNTRDTFGFAMKATYVEMTEMVGTSFGEVGTMDVPKTIGKEIFKDPITDDGTKKSATGLLKVIWDPSAKQYKLLDKQSWDQENLVDNQLRTIYKDGEFHNQTTLTEIRNRLK